LDLISLEAAPCVKVETLTTSATRCWRMDLNLLYIHWDPIGFMTNVLPAIICSHNDKYIRCILDNSKFRERRMSNRPAELISHGCIYDGCGKSATKRMGDKWSPWPIPLIQWDTLMETTNKSKDIALVWPSWQFLNQCCICI
jgi:hypothetical protein